MTKLQQVFVIVGCAGGWLYLFFFVIGMAQTVVQAVKRKRAKHAAEKHFSKDHLGDEDAEL